MSNSFRRRPPTCWSRAPAVTAYSRVGIFPASLEWHIATSNKWLESRGLAKSASGQDDGRAKSPRLKGTTIGAATVGGAPAQVVRYLLRQNNLKPDADVRFAAVGAGLSRVNALKNGHGRHDCRRHSRHRAAGTGRLGLDLLRLGHEIDIFKDYPHESVHALENYIKANPTRRALYCARSRAAIISSSTIPPSPTICWSNNFRRSARPCSRP